MEIRLAQPKDIPAILNLLDQVGQVHHQIRPDLFPAGTRKYDEIAMKDLLLDPDRPIFVAVSEETVLGYCFCKVKSFPDSTSSVERRELYIDDLCVDEDHRGTGVARPLYDHAKAYGKQRHCGSLTLNVWCGNERAMAFYEKCGLRPRNIMMETLLEADEC